MGFDDLENAVEEQDNGESNSSSDDQPESPTTRDQNTTSESTPTPETITTPAFEFDDTIQKAFYAREESWREFNAAADFDIKRALHEEGVDDVSRSEITEAVLWTAIEHPEEVAEQLLAMRRGKKL